MRIVGDVASILSHRGAYPCPALTRPFDPMLRIYLDQKDWIALLKAAANRPERASHADALFYAPESAPAK